MREITYSEAIREALCEEMRLNPHAFLMGEDVAVFGGVWGVSEGMLAEFSGHHRRWAWFSYGRHAADCRDHVWRFFDVRRRPTC